MYNIIKKHQYSYVDIIKKNFATQILKKINSTYSVDALVLVHISTVTTCMNCHKVHHSTPDTIYLYQINTQ